MLINIASIYECNAKELYEELKKTRTLIYVSRPLLHFTPCPGCELPETWERLKIQVKLSLFGFIPFGTQCVDVSVDDESMHIHDGGSSDTVSKWDHNMYVQQVGPNKTLYVDSVDIEAGLMTPFVVLFAHILYRHRQRRGKHLADRLESK